jgi:hypothetical protein
MTNVDFLLPYKNAVFQYDTQQNGGDNSSKYNQKITRTGILWEENGCKQHITGKRAPQDINGTRKPVRIRSLSFSSVTGGIKTPDKYNQSQPSIGRKLLPCKPKVLHQAIHNKRRARHITRIFQNCQGNKQEHQHRDKNQHHRDPAIISSRNKLSTSFRPIQSRQ